MLSSQPLLLTVLFPCAQPWQNVGLSAVENMGLLRQVRLLIRLVRHVRQILLVLSPHRQQF